MPNGKTKHAQSGLVLRFGKLIVWRTKNCWIGESVNPETIQAIGQIVGYTFNDASLLGCALTHSSRRTEVGFSYERLEFLGDAVVGMAVAEYLFRACPDRDEGALTKMKSSVVSGRTLARIARQIGIEKFVEVDKGIAAQAQLPDSVLSDVFESIIGAIYLDSGYDAVRQTVLALLRGPIEDAVASKYAPDYKSRLQEWAHIAMRATPTYKLLAEKGPDHTKRFQTAVVISGKQYGVAWGDNKRDSEQEAAAETLRQLGVSADAPPALPAE
jgi:ribonuclease III